MVCNVHMLLEEFTAPTVIKRYLGSLSLLSVTAFKSVIATRFSSRSLHALYLLLLLYVWLLYSNQKVSRLSVTALCHCCYCYQEFVAT